MSKISLKRATIIWLMASLCVTLLCSCGHPAASADQSGDRLNQSMSANQKALIADRKKKADEQ